MHFQVDIMVKSFGDHFRAMCIMTEMSMEKDLRICLQTFLNGGITTQRPKKASKIQSAFETQLAQGF